MIRHTTDGSAFVDILIAEGHTDFIVLEPRQSFDGGIIGFRTTTNQLIYGLGALLQSLITTGFSRKEDVEEWVSYNTLGTCVGLPDSPLIVVKNFRGGWTDIVHDEPVEIEMQEV